MENKKYDDWCMSRWMLDDLIMHSDRKILTKFNKEIKKEFEFQKTVIKRDGMDKMLASTDEALFLLWALPRRIIRIYEQLKGNPVKGRISRELELKREKIKSARREKLGA